MKIFNFATFTLAAMTAVSAAATPANAPHIPASWTTLPEEGGEQYLNAPFQLQGVDHANLDDGLHHIFAAQRDALSSVATPKLHIAPPANQPSDWVPWRFVAMASDLSVSASGLIGVLGFKGTPSISVYWQKKENHGKHKLNAETEAPATIPVFEFQGTPTAPQREAQLDAIERTVIASGRVKKSAALRTNLEKVVNRFNDMSTAVNMAPADDVWYPSRLRVDLEITASGRVKWGTIGGGVKIRLEWHRVQTAASPAPQKIPGSLTVTQKSLRTLVGSVAEDLAAASANYPSPIFRANVFYVGLGLTASGNVGIAKASASAMGYLYFTHAQPSKHFAPPSIERFKDAAWYLIDENPSVETMKYARTKGIQYVQERSLDDDRSSTMFRIDRQQFRTGLKKAFQIGDYFSEKARESSSEQWGVSTVKPGFAMSISGDVGLVKLTGQIAAQIEFNDKNF